MTRVIRSSILLFGAAATVLALKVQSVQALWFFTSDLVFVLLFPQLVSRCSIRKPIAPDRSRPSPCRLVLRVGRRRDRCSGCRQLIPYPETVRSERLPPVPDSCCCRSCRARSGVEIGRGRCAARPGDEADMDMARTACAGGLLRFYRRPMSRLENLVELRTR